jgi:dephospho-CoA kinase|tara:strand:- start:118 stop:714 length:597 start_codon:yes stop_codon:yes gene_type:complete
MFVVGLTGGIGSGKTIASDRFEELGVKVVDADIASRVVVEIGKPALSSIEGEFGSDVISDDGSLNRAKLREIIFKDDEAKSWLESLLHPLIGQHILDEIASATSRYVILVSPLLFETTQFQMCNRTLLIDVPKDIQILRTAKRDKVPESQVEKIIASQMDRDQKIGKADDVIVNDGEIGDLISKIDKIHQRYIELADG